MYPYQQQYNGQQPQQPMQSQATGFGNYNPQASSGYVQPQQTGYNFQQMPQQYQAQPAPQTQLTGAYGGGFGNNFSQPLAQQATGFYQPPPSQQSQFSQNQQPLQQQQQQQSLNFQQTGVPQSSAQTENTELKIPDVRISFITLEDQKKFEHLFRSGVPKGENAIDGNTARDILMRSNLPASQLADIWALSDTTKSGKLLFPEFALALHLCNVALRGESLPYELPTSMKNEINNFVDSINFYLPENDTAPASNSTVEAVRPQATGFSSFGAPQAQMPAQATGFQTAPLQSQRTGFMNSLGLAPQPTGFQAPPLPQTSFQAPAAGTAQPTGGFNSSTPLQPQTTGFTSVLTNQTGIVPQPTGSVRPQQTGSGFVQGQVTGLAQQQTGYGGMQPQLTGMAPQQTGFSTLPPMPTGPLVPQKTGGLTNFFNTVNEAPVVKSTEWAISAQERGTFEKIFKNISTQGYISGQQAIQVLSKSGLGRPDLEKIWTLSDINNRGKLNKDEFSVAMHLIYRRLSGFEIPTYLPAELVPPSTRVLDDVKDSLKSQNSFGKKASRINPSVTGNFKYDDDGSDMYVSNRRRKTDDSFGSPARKDEAENEDKDVVIEKLKKTLQEKKILLAAIDARDEDNTTDSYSSQRLANEIETLKIKAKDAQTRLAESSGATSLEQKQQLLNRLRGATDRLPTLMSQLSDVDEQIKTAKIDLFKAKLQKESPSIKFYASDAEKARAKSKLLMQQRMAALTGKPAPSLEGLEDGEARLEAEKEKINKETETKTVAMKELELSIKAIADGVSSQLETSNTDAAGFNKFEKGQGISTAEVRQFIDALRAIKPIAPQQTPSSGNTTNGTYSTSRNTSSSSIASPPPASNMDRASYIKQQAQERMNARLAKLGIRRGQPNAAAPTQAPQSPQPPTEAVAPKPKESPAQPPPPPAKRHTSTLVPTAPSAPPSAPVENDDDEEDEVLAALMAEKAKLEEAEKAKAKKRADRKAEIARLRAEMEALKNKEESDSENEEPSVAVSKKLDEIKTVEQEAAKEAVAEPHTVVQPPAQPQAPAQAPAQAHQESSKASVHANNNPFFKPGTSEPISQSQTPVAQRPNPFFKPGSSKNSSSSSLQQQAAFDKNAAEAQRRAQRGVQNDDDDDWGDGPASDEDEEDAIPLRGPAHLASLLFGGGSSTPAAPSPQQSAPAPPQDSALEQPASVSAEEANTTVNNTDADDDFTTPPSGGSTPVPDSVAPPIPSAPPIPAAPPIPVAGNGFASSADAAVTPAPQVSAPPPPPPLPSMEAPPMAPPLPGSAAPPPPPPPAPPAMSSPSAPSAPAAPSPPAPGAAPNMSALLGQIQGGKSLKKVSDTEKHHATGSTVGKVL